MVKPTDHLYLHFFNDIHIMVEHFLALWRFSADLNEDSMLLLISWPKELDYEPKKQGGTSLRSYISVDRTMFICNSQKCKVNKVIDFST